MTTLGFSQDGPHRHDFDPPEKAMFFPSGSERAARIQSFRADFVNSLLAKKVQQLEIAESWNSFCMHRRVSGFGRRENFPNPVESDSNPAAG